MNKLDDLFKKKLAEQQFDGKDKYWAQLEKKLTENAQEKVVIAWYKKWLLPVIAIVTIGMAALIYNSNLFTDEPAISANSNQSKQLSSAQEVASLSAEKTEIEAADKATHTADISNLSVKTDALNAQSNENKTISNYNNKSINNLQAGPQQTAKANEPVVAANNAAKLTNAAKAVTAGQFINAKEPELSNTEIEESNVNGYVQSNNAIAETQKTNAINTSDSDSYVSEQAASTGISASYKGLDFSQVEMPLAYLSPKALSALIYPETSFDINASLMPVKADQSKLIMNLSVYGGAIYSMKQLMTSEGNTASYLNRRKNEETNSIKPNAGIDLEIKRGHWTFTSGVNFHQQGENRNYSDQFKRLIPYDSLVININNNSSWLVDSSMFYSLQYNTIVSSYDSTITYYDENTGLFTTAQLPVNFTQSIVVDTNFYYLIDSSYNQNIDTVKTNYELKKQVIVSDPKQAHLKGRNTFSYIEVPILIGYEWGLKRWRLSLKGGIGVGMLTRQQSFYLTSDEAEIAPVSTAVYTKMIYNGILRAGLHYNFTPQFGIDIVPFSRLNINNMTNKNAPFKQKYYNAGLQVGFSYKL